jgi:hypothetical protein
MRTTYYWSLVKLTLNIISELQGTYDPSFSLALQCKDNRLGYQIAAKHKVQYIFPISDHGQVELLHGTTVDHVL